MKIHYDLKRISQIGLKNISEIERKVSIEHITAQKSEIDLIKNSKTHI